ncbi:hypothetical protein NDU88_002476 [Pleurodeles waltl]|uniref:Uncharacterized protein n=1 Tax=Pleurodeles waltl TaxID=8319 RepID=A0AAV7RB42_PLEWA|nr:hypothetical protein NDU88_002476 [Pleurodeles waltl]
MHPLRFLRGSAGIQQQVGPEIRPCRQRPIQRRCSTPHSGAALPRSIVCTRDHHHRPRASSSVPVKLGTPPWAPAPAPFLSLRPRVRTPGRPRAATTAAALRSSWARGSTPANLAGTGTTEALREREPLLASSFHLHGSARRRCASWARPG